MKDLWERPYASEHENRYLKGLGENAEEGFMEGRQIITNSFDKSY